MLVADGGCISNPIECRHVLKTNNNWSRSEVRVPETRLVAIKNQRGLAIDDTFSDEEVGLYTRAYREETRRLRSKLARSGGVIGCVSSVVIPILFLISLIGSLPSGEWNL